MSRRSSYACIVALVFVCCGLALAQTASVYELTYFDNNLQNAPLSPGTIFILNPGLTGSPISGNTDNIPDPMLQILPGGPVMTFEGTLCANIYVFDDVQEMLECCACPLTANGPLIIPMEELMDNPLTVLPRRGVIKVISSIPDPLCDPTDLSQPTPELRSFATHLQNDSRVIGTPLFSLTEERFALAPLSAIEQNDLGQICAFVRYLGTGRGRCDEACTDVVAGN